MSTGSIPSTVIALVRHGQSEGNAGGHIGGHGPTPLTDFGLRQAQATARALARDFQPTVLVSSDLVRAHQTAEPIAAATGLNIRFEPRLRERSLGVLDGLSFHECEARYPQHWELLKSRDPNACPPGGETVDQVFARVGAAIDELAKTYAGERVVAVSHGLAIFHAFAHITGLGSPAHGLKVFSLVDNCSISIFHYQSGDNDTWYWRLECMNDRAHVRELG